MSNTKHEAPAEGAGEALGAAENLHAAAMIYEDQAMLEDAETVLSALRASSSAPEAREGEAVGVVHGLKADLNTAELPDGTLLYTHPAHPSADHAELLVLLQAMYETAGGPHAEWDRIDACAASLLSEIAALRGEVDVLTTSGIIEVAVRNPSVADYVQHWERRATQAERQRDDVIALLQELQSSVSNRLANQGADQ